VVQFNFYSVPSTKKKKQKTKNGFLLGYCSFGRFMINGREECILLFSFCEPFLLSVSWTFTFFFFLILFLDGVCNIQFVLFTAAAVVVNGAVRTS